MTVINTKYLAKKLLGRTIVEVDFQRFRGASGEGVAEPRLTLNDGSMLQFYVRQLEDDYAVEMLYVGLDERNDHDR